MTEKEIKSEFKRYDKYFAEQNPRLVISSTKSLRKILTKDQAWFYAKTYFWENLAYKHLGEYKKSEKVASKGIALFRKLNDFVEVSKILRDQGLAYEYVGEFDKAIEKLRESFDELKSHDVIDAAGITLSKLGQLYLKKGDLDKAKYYCEIGYNICAEGANSFFLITSILPLSLVYYRIGNYSMGLELIDQASELLELLNLENSFVNLRREGEIALRRALLLLGINKYSESYKNFLIFSMICLTTEEQERAFFTKSQDVRELLKSLLEAGYKDKIVKTFKEQYNIDVNKLSSELEIPLN